MARWPSQANPDNAGMMESVVLTGTDADIVNASMLRVARTIDASDSGRDINALMKTLMDLMDRRKAMAQPMESATEEASFVDRFRVLAGSQGLPGADQAGGGRVDANAG